MEADYSNAEKDENFINTKFATAPIIINIHPACSIVPIVPIWIAITYVRNQSNIRNQLKTYCLQIRKNSKIGLKTYKNVIIIIAEN